MATKKSEKKYDHEAFVRKMSKLDSEYRIVLAHIELLQEQKERLESEIQTLMDSTAGLI